MRARLLRLMLLAVLPVFAGCAGSADRETSAAGDPPQWASDQIIVALDARDEAAVEATVARIERDHEVAALKRFPLTSIGVMCIVFRVAPGASPATLARRIDAMSDVRLAQVNQVFTSRGGASDRYARLQWAATATGVDRLREHLRGTGVRVGIVDTAVDVRHPDLAGAVASAENFVADGVAADAAEAHGTAVAGIIAAREGNGHGIVGAAPDADLFVARACWYRTPDAATAHCSSWSLARAVDHLLAERVKVVNLSLAGPADVLLGEVIAQAVRRGVIVVASTRAGPDGPGFPASRPDVVAVVAGDSSGGHMQDGWHAEVAPVIAPGVEVLTTLPPARYQHMSGSSMAAGFVSGVAALMIEAAPSASGARVAAALRAARGPLGCAAVEQLTGLARC